MESLLTRRTLLAAGTTALAAGAGCLGDDGGGTDDEMDGDGTDEPAASESTTWTETSFEDVTTGDSFELGSFDEPVLVHFFAVWCSKCDRQERQVDELRTDREDFTMVSLNVDPDETGDRIRQHAESNDYDWRWAVVPEETTSEIVDEFGSDVVNPPTVPKVVLCPDGEATRIDDGVLSPAELSAELDDAC